MKDFNLLGKDYLSQAEAAHYCCMSLSQFQKVSRAENLRPASFGGKLVYRRTDLQRAIEDKWRSFEELMGRGFSTGMKTASAIGRSSVGSQSFQKRLQRKSLPGNALNSPPRTNSSAQVMPHASPGS